MLCMNVFAGIKRGLLHNIVKTYIKIIKNNPPQLIGNFSNQLLKRTKTKAYAVYVCFNNVSEQISFVTSSASWSFQVGLKNLRWF